MLIILFNFVMEIYFEDPKLLELASDEKKAIRKLGKLQSKLFLRRLESLYIASSPSELDYLPGNFHLLKHERRGQWACNLKHPYRLIFEISLFEKENKVLKEAANRYYVTIIEIIDYH